MTPTLSQDGMRYWRLLPDARLRAWVYCYWWVEPAAGPSTRVLASDAPDLLLPDGHSEIVFRMAGEFTRWPLETGVRARMTESYVIGGRSQSVLTMSPGGLRLAGVKLEPRALRSLLGMPLTEFRDATVSLSQFSGLLDLEDEVANLRDAGRLAEVLDRFFLRALGDKLQDDPAVHLLVERIRATHGGQPIMEWARDHGISARTLERRFVARMGMTPKQFARVARFKHSYRLWSQIATALPACRRAHLEGFYDESHFDREFRHFMGTSPLGRVRGQTRFTTTIADHLLEAG